MFINQTLLHVPVVKQIVCVCVRARVGSFGSGGDGQSREAGFSGHRRRPPPVQRRVVQSQPAALFTLKQLHTDKSQIAVAAVEIKSNITPV